jgi:hypothetical protein
LFSDKEFGRKSDGKHEVLTRYGSQEPEFAATAEDSVPVAMTAEVDG